MNLHAPIVSILIPVYNRSEYIAECIQSALDQTFSALEIVIVDNASNDGTWEIVQRFAESDSRVRIFRNQTNIGPVQNWKRCVEEAKGQLCKILFSDDWLEPNCLSEMVPKMVDPTVSLVYCAVHIGETKENAIIAYAKAESSRLSPSEYLNHILHNKAPVSPGAILIRTNDLRRNLHAHFPTSTPRSFEMNGAGPDVMISLLTIENYPYVANVSTPLVFFRVHVGSYTIENSKNLVFKGYRSAISYYLIKNHKRHSWLDYLGRGWLQQMSVDRRWINPRTYLIEYEGTGLQNELLVMFTFAFKHLVTRLFKFSVRRKIATRKCQTN